MYTKIDTGILAYFYKTVNIRNAIISGKQRLT